VEKFLVLVCSNCFLSGVGSEDLADTPMDKIVANEYFMWVVGALEEIYIDYKAFL